MSIFISYIFLGLSLSAPMGPINAAQLDRGIRFGFMNAWLVGFGAMIADGVFMMLIYFGLAQVIDTPFMKTFLWLFGFFVLTYTGIENIAKANSIGGKETSNRNGSNRKSFQTGFFIAISNPLNILFWLGIYGSILAQTSSMVDGKQLLLYSTGIFLGITLWDLTMASAAAGARAWVNPNMLKRISILSGITLIGFGFYFGIQAIKLFIG